jgi:hypothetical protein
MPFAGFDLARYPGDSLMQSLWDSSNLYWVGFYLAVGGPGFGDKQSWSGKFGGLQNIGWGVAPIYVGKQPTSHKLAMKAGAEEFEGYMDGMEATNLASQEGIPFRTVLYFDLEMPTGSQPWLTYFFGWSTAVTAQGYTPGIYCSYLSAKTVTAFIRQRNASMVPEIRVFNVDHFPGHQSYKDINSVPTPDPAGAGGAGASSWQYVQGSRLAWDQHAISPVDFNSSTFSDPGQRTIIATT